MKAQKINKKLLFKKLTISHLSDIHGGGSDDRTKTCVSVCAEAETCYTCYQYTCIGWTDCPIIAC